MKENNHIKIGITHGDINGVGYEIILKTFTDSRMLEEAIFVLYGSSKVAGFHRKTLDLPTVPFQLIHTPDEAVEGKLNVINCCGDDLQVDLGISSPKAGAAALGALELATSHLKDGLIDTLVTAPINKHNIQSDNFHFKGHTEYLAEKFASKKQKPLMILVKDQLKVALVTGHIPLKEVSERLTKEKIKETITLFDSSLKSDFGIQKPRIAVLSLNPHAGDNGLLGDEEQAVIIPAIKEASDNDILVVGPYPSDGFFGSGAFSRFDGIVAMYHDQGLTPFKTLAMEDGVNFTAGLPIVRTSPAHGTGYDIAGKNQAHEESFRAAIYLSMDVYRKRKWLEQISENPLKKMYFDKGKGKDESVDLTQEGESLI